MKLHLLSALALFAAPLIAQTPPQASPTDAAVARELPPSSPPAAPAPKPATVKVVLTTSEGAIVLELEKGRAPITTANFLKYVDAKRFDGIGFYRAVKVQPGFGLIQAGLRNDPKKIFPSIAHEPTTKTGVHHVDGAISMARAAPGSASADFFIMVGASPQMDADPSQPGDNLGFAAFGRVIEGMDLVRKIMDEPTSATGGPATMKGQMLVAPVKILTARRSG
ncbi:peptidylprolyl isomerase [Sphingomonas sp. BIUV-7]|uniref:peptidylprolyl isomerase n=1 Tax=Sphingomonas natans TaxID=3063330 RepID=A0ABT8Y9P0_9SPHN|nr:peptidylprolyl isomerase [Sphingomonas sp. BIUV-7]MDO6415046.1 peptidylprolyl isomerase [Sphingomonas sp. BIUV-7]